MHAGLSVGLLWGTSTRDFARMKLTSATPAHPERDDQKTPRISFADWKGIIIHEEGHATEGCIRWVDGYGSSLNACLCEGGRWRPDSLASSEIQALFM
jgi:hypothetical protein